MDKERHHCFLSKKPRMTDGARDDVTKHDDAEARDANAAQDHKQVFEGIEYAPFQVALFVQDQAVEAHRSIPKLQLGPGRREADGLPALASGLLYVANEPKDLHSVRAKVRRKLV